MPITVKQLANHCKARIEGGNDESLICSVADIRSAQPGQVTQLTQSRYAKYLENCAATACFIKEGFLPTKTPDGLTLLICPDPEISFIDAINYLHPAPEYPTNVASHAIVDPTVELGINVYVGPYAVISAGATIGESSKILPGVYIGRNVTIGTQCIIHPYAVIYDNTRIGNHVVIHAGAIIGADGFSYKFRNHQHVKVPQVGYVTISDHVEIGANTCIDRGALGCTSIGAGSKIDNLVQIGHNNQIGQHVIMCGQVGVSGSCQIDDYAVLAGSAGIADHVTIGQGAVVMARSGVASDVAAAGQVFGSPAKDKRQAYKEQAALGKLPELIKKIQALEARLAKCEK